MEKLISVFAGFLLGVLVTLIYPGIVFRITSPSRTEMIKELSVVEGRVDPNKNFKNLVGILFEDIKSKNPGKIKLIEKGSFIDKFGDSNEALLKEFVAIMEKMYNSRYETITDRQIYSLLMIMKSSDFQKINSKISG